MATDHKKPAAPSEKVAKNAYEETQKLLENTKKTGFLAPMVNMLTSLVKHPELKKTLEEAPAAHTGASAPKKPLN